MEDITVITQLISGLGFPIAVCLICFWYITQKDKQHKDEIDKLCEQQREDTAGLREETQRLSEAINNNTAVMQSLLNKLDD